MSSISLSLSTLGGRALALVCLLHVAACPGPGGATDAGSGSEASSTSEDTTGEPTTDGSSSGGSSTGEAPLQCDPLPGAPPPIEVKDALIVPIDLTSVEAELSFDNLAREIQGRARVEFRAGHVEGLPIFDLSQTITRAVLDGEELPPEAIVDFDPAEDATMRVVERVLAPCSEHTLELEYRVEQPPNETYNSFLFTAGKISWATYLIDFGARRFAEKWFPSNLIHDTLDLTVDIVISNTGDAHEVFANAPVTQVDPKRWRVAFEDATSMTPLIQLCASYAAHATSTEVETAGGTVVVDSWYCDTWEGPLTDAAEFIPDVASALQFAASELGPYPHDGRFVVVPKSNAFPLYSMEYPGGTVTQRFAIPHEVFHSWIGRGVRPLTQRDAWFDEAWTSFVVDGEFMATPVPLDAPPSTLADDNRWVRTFPFESSSRGAALLAALAAETGLPLFRQILRDIYTKYAGQALDTETLERELHCRVGGDLTRRLFHRFVYGEAGEPAAAPADYCEGTA